MDVFLQELYNPICYIEEEENVYEKVLTSVNKYLKYEGYRLEIVKNQVEIKFVDNVKEESTSEEEKTTVLQNQLDAKTKELEDYMQYYNALLQDHERLQKILSEQKNIDSLNETVDSLTTKIRQLTKENGIKDEIIKNLRNNEGNRFAYYVMTTIEKIDEFVQKEECDASQRQAFKNFQYSLKNDASYVTKIEAGYVEHRDIVCLPQKLTFCQTYALVNILKEKELIGTKTKDIDLLQTFCPLAPQEQPIIYWKGTQSKLYAIIKEIYGSEEITNKMKESVLKIFCKEDGEQWKSFNEKEPPKGNGEDFNVLLKYIKNNILPISL